jgi:prefoldin subunit 5
MCGFTIDLIDFDQLTNAQRRTLLRKLQRERKALQSQLEHVNESLKGVDQSIEVIERSSQRRR